MPLFLMVPVAAAISLGLALVVVYGIGLLLEATLGHGAAVNVIVYGAFASIFYAVVTMIVMAITLLYARTARAIKITLIVLLVAIAPMLLLGMIIPFGPRIDYVVMLQVPLVLIAIPLVLTVVVQWLLLRRNLRQAR